MCELTALNNDAGMGQKCFGDNHIRSKCVHFVSWAHIFPFPEHAAAYGTSWVFNDSKVHRIVLCRYHDTEVCSGNHDSIFWCNGNSILREISILFVSDEEIRALHFIVVPSWACICSYQPRWQLWLTWPLHSDIFTRVHIYALRHYIILL